MLQTRRTEYGPMRIVTAPVAVTAEFALMKSNKRGTPATHPLRAPLCNYLYYSANFEDCVTLVSAEMNGVIT
jgi:hypothetical protein